MNREPEIWKPIIGYEEKYLISSFGKVVSLNYNRTGKRKELLCQNDKDGYQTVTLCKNGKSRLLKIHRLVGAHFIPNPNNLVEINHKDGNKSNNYFENLEWSTRLGNIMHSYEFGLKPKTTEKQRAAVLLTNSKKRGTKYGIRSNAARY